MSFDLAFDYRGSAGYTTDPAYACAALGTGEGYPHTYTNGNGQSINAGWDTTLNFLNLVATNDPRIAGSHFCPNIPSFTPTFQVDLASGSAPGAGTYTIDIACGEPGNATKAYYKLFDNTTVLIDGSAGTALASDHYLDASLADVGATTLWTGTTVSKTFATTTVKLQLNPNAVDNAFADNVGLAHFRLTLQTGGGTAYTLAADTGAFTLNLNPIQPVANVRTTTFALTGFPAALRWSAAGGGLTAYHHHYGG